VEDDVDVWRYAVVSCMPETTKSLRLMFNGRIHELCTVLQSLEHCIHDPML